MTKDNVEKYLGPKLEQAIWKNFRQNYWEKSAQVIDMSAQAPLAHLNEVFSCLLSASMRYRDQGNFSDLKMYLNGRQLVQELKSLLPLAIDLDFAHYMKRLDEITNASEFIIYVNNFQAYNWPLYVRIKRFITGFLQEVQITPSSIEVELFAGRYAKTPGGIHKDGCTNLHFVISGTKIFHIWPSFLKPRTEEVVIKQKYSGEEEYLDSADLSWETEHRIDFKAKQGQFIYCPHNWWHIGNSPEFCVCLNIAIYSEDCTTSLIEASIKQVTNKLNAYLDSNGATSIEDKSKSILEGLAEQIAAGKIDEDIRLGKLKLTSSFGLIPPPKTNIPYTLTDDVVFYYNSSSHLEYVVLQDKILYAANGHVEYLPNNDFYINLFETIKKSNEFTLADFRKEFMFEFSHIIYNLIEMQSIFILPKQMV